METLAATPINLLPTTDVQGRRTPTEANGDDAGSFEQLLDEEIALVSPEATGAAAAAGAELLAATLTPASDQSTQPADGTQMLDAILDSASIVPGAAIAPLIANVEDMQPNPGEARALQGRTITAATLQAPIAASVPQPQIDPALAQITDGDAPPAIHVPLPETQLPAAQASAVQAAATAATAAPATLLASTAGMQPAAEGLAFTQKTAAPGQKPAAPVTAVPGAPETRAHRDPVGMQPRDELLALRADAAVERAQIETFVTRAETDRAPTSDAAAQPANTGSSLDALSSAALMPKWAPASHTSGATGASTPATARIDTPLGTEAWGDAFRQKVVWLVDRQQQSAELHVNPPHLGPVEVMLNLGDDGARIVFCSPHASVRDAIEASLAALRTALADNGLSLGQALVSADPGAAREQFREELARGPQGAARASAEALPATETQATRPLRRGLVDIFA